MNDLKTSSGEQRPSASELRKLPRDKQEAILEAQAALAEELYRRDPGLTAFEAFDEVDVDADRPLPWSRE